MDSINTDNLASKTTKLNASLANLRSNSVSPEVHNQATSKTQSNLTDISKISEKASSSTPDLRDDVIAKAEVLLNDPNWLSDSNLDLLASKISQEENL